MIEKSNGSEKCHNCGSGNIAGPFKLYRGTIYFRAFRVARHQAFVCQDCYHSMLFIREKDEEMFNREIRRLQGQYK
ncbi:MAG: hypothetical protein ACFFDM_03110 [Candidatus Thorarchaeota archaeon]